MILHQLQNFCRSTIFLVLRVEKESIYEHPNSWSRPVANFFSIFTSLGTLTRKNMNLPCSIRMYWTNFWHPNVNVQQNIFEKTLIEVGCSHLYASFGTFCVQIGQLFAAQWIFETCLKFNKSLSWKENVDDFAIFPNVKSLTVLEIIDQFGRKRCQKKRKDANY